MPGFDVRHREPLACPVLRSSLYILIMRYRFGSFVLDSLTGTVVGPDGPVTLRRQTFRLLEVLLEHAPELLDRDTLLDEAWGRTALSPNVLPQAVSELRQALGDNAKEPRYIETLHRRGYRLACTVQRVDDCEADIAARPVPEPGNDAITVDGHIFPAQDGPARSTKIALGLSVVALIGLSLMWWHQSTQRDWLHGTVVPEIRELLKTDLAAAWMLAREARAHAPNDIQLDQLWRDISLPVSLTSVPEGATISVRGYGASSSDWIELGTTPLEDVYLPLAQMRYRISLPGHRTIEVAPSVLPAAEPFHLHRIDEAPEDMVHVPAGQLTYRDQRVSLPSFWIDRHEVTNRAYREFIEAGGYRDQDLWTELMEAGEHQSPFVQQVADFVDSTGMPGPATWAMGTWPDGKANHPVEGVSWFEAMAYARWAGKQLPTIFHWRRAAGLGTAQISNFSDILLSSNFNGRGTVASGELDGLGPYGTLDMAGNVAEWCLNPAESLRHLAGGSWMEQGYRFRDPEARDPYARGPGTGFRLMRQDEPLDETLATDVDASSFTVPEPVDDDTFAIYARQFDYDPLPLDARVETGDSSHSDWYRERVSFTTAYPGERVTAWVYLPRNARPPYPTVVHFPGGDALMLDSSEKAGLHHVEPFLRSGHAVVYPVYKGTFERNVGSPSGPNTWRMLLIDQVRDLRRTVDYLETRDDIDLQRLALHAVSYGGYRAPYALAVDRRFRTAILVSAGVIPVDNIPPEVQLQDYLPRVDIPVLLINGRNDFNFPHETSQKPLFDLLGTAPEDKRHVILDWGHLPPHYTDVIRAYIDWTERWLKSTSRQATDGVALE
ncbi:SUMF1/EgtB/PvdO family nonheme iron enzyme [Wenzhouxiangella sp. EGI_FJ10305]|uniref:SUMF1/EgtB/PvdO family nonheme iron enzyme n=1 Tax=Wenzhouxiangella sp. EGI_FJ10305 TaxID=3243768 RepID=UPI0035DDA797